MLKTVAAVLLILAGLAGFVFSYAFAYGKITRVLDQAPDQTTGIVWSVRR